MKLPALLALLAFLLCAADARGDEVAKFSAGINGVWFDNQANPSDFELGGTARASLSPHLSAVGSVFYGLEHSYVRGQFGGRATVTDVDNRDLSVGIGFVYQASSEPALRRQEWTPEVTIGYRPWPKELPRVVIGGAAAYGLESKVPFLTLAGRYSFGGD